MMFLEAVSLAMLLGVLVVVRRLVALAAVILAFLWLLGVILLPTLNPWLVFVLTLVLVM